MTSITHITTTTQSIPPHTILIAPQKKIKTFDDNFGLEAVPTLTELACDLKCNCLLCRVPKSGRAFYANSISKKTNRKRGLIFKYM